MSGSFKKNLKKIKWIDSSELHFPLTKEEFIQRLESNLDPYRPQGMFEAFSSSPNDYVGKIKGDMVLMRRKRKIFDWTGGAVLVDGRLRESVGGVVFSSEIKFPDWIPRIVIIFLSLIYGFFFLLFFSGTLTPEESWMGLFLLLHAVIILSVFYLLFRKAISSGKYHFEKDIKEFMK